MKWGILATGKIEEYNDSYGARLIEQGRAVLAPEKKPAAKKPASDRSGKE